MTYLIQMSMLFAGIANLFQTIGMGPVGPVRTKWVKNGHIL